MNKPIVNYVPTSNDVIVLHQHAWIYPTNHPSYLVSNQTIARTSRVIKIDEQGFETENTIYRPTFTEFQE